MNVFIDRYQPRWLYLHEFCLSLGGDEADEDALKDAIALLVRDRLIVDGKLNEHEFRFLEGKPDLRTSAWINDLCVDDFNWATSEILAGVDTTEPRTRPSDTIGILIEIASCAVRYFGEPASEPRRDRDGPQVIRAKVLLEKVFGCVEPPRSQTTDSMLVKKVTDAIPTGDQPISRDSILRAAGRATNRSKMRK
jgi:hypothetical protein